MMQDHQQLLLVQQRLEHLECWASAPAGWRDARDGGPLPVEAHVVRAELPVPAAAAAAAAAVCHALPLAATSGLQSLSPTA